MISHSSTPYDQQSEPAEKIFSSRDSIAIHLMGNLADAFEMEKGLRTEEKETGKRFGMR